MVIVVLQCDVQYVIFVVFKFYKCIHAQIFLVDLIISFMFLLSNLICDSHNVKNDVSNVLKVLKDILNVEDDDPVGRLW